MGAARAAARLMQPGEVPVRLYLEVARAAFLRYATYRAATVAGVLTNSAFGFLRAYVFIAVFAVNPSIGGYSVQDAITYTWLTQALIMTVYMWGWYEIAEAIRSGDIVTDFQRPVDFQLYWLAQDLGRALYHLLGRGVAPVLIGALFFDLLYPSSVAQVAALAVSVTLAVTISFGWRFLLNLTGFWLTEVRGAGYLAMTLMTLLSGFLVPLTFFPQPWRALAEALPFAGVIAVPIDIYLGKLAGPELLRALAWQAGWAAVLLAAGRVVLARALRKIEVHGG